MSPENAGHLSAEIICGQTNGTTVDQSEAIGEREAVYLTAHQVAQLLGVSEKTVSRWSLEDASMPVLRRGRVVRFHRGRLMLWLERHEPRGSRQRAQKGRHIG